MNQQNAKSNKGKFQKGKAPQKGPQNGMSEKAYLRVNGTIAITFHDAKVMTGKLIGFDAYNFFLQPKDQDYTLMIPKHSIKYCRMARLQTKTTQDAKTEA